MLARTCINAGAVREATNDRNGALASYEHARELLEALDREKPGFPENPRSPGHPLQQPRQRQPRPRPPRRLPRRLRHRRWPCRSASSGATRSNPVPQRELAVTYVNVAILYNHRGDRDEALRWHQKARDLQEKLHRDHPLTATCSTTWPSRCRRIGDRLVRDGPAGRRLEIPAKGPRADRGARQRQQERDRVPVGAGAQPPLARPRPPRWRSRPTPPRIRPRRTRARRGSQVVPRRHRPVERGPPPGPLGRPSTRATWPPPSSTWACCPTTRTSRKTPRASTPAADLYRELARTGTDADALRHLAERPPTWATSAAPATVAGALAAFNDCREIRERLVRLRPAGRATATTSRPPGSTSPGPTRPRAGRDSPGSAVRHGRRHRGVSRG